MPAANPPYSPEFRREAIRLACSATGRVTHSENRQRVRDLSQNSSQLGKAEEIDTGEREGLATNKQEELRKLRKENKG